MLKVQAYLRGGKQPVDLEKEFGIRIYRHPVHPIWGFKYSQIESPKTHPIVRECRGLVLEENSWNLVAKPFTRFFNIGEHLDEYKKFNWDNFSAYNKEDGSLTIVYKYGKSYQVNTSGSFGLANMSSTIDFTWRDLFWHAAPFSPKDLNKHKLDNITLVCELCSPYNKIVTIYPEPRIFLLAAFDRRTGKELTCQKVDQIAKKLGATRPSRHYFKNKLEVRDFIEENRKKDPTWEGFVLKDSNGLRFKWKSSDYLIRHRIKDNGNVFHPKNLIPLVLENEQEEFKLTMPETSSALDKTKEVLDKSLDELVLLWETYKTEQYQKNFALRVKHHPLVGILFKLRKIDQLASKEQLLRAVREKDENGCYVNLNLIFKKLFGNVRFNADILIQSSIEIEKEIDESFGD